MKVNLVPADIMKIAPCVTIVIMKKHQQKHNPMLTMSGKIQQRITIEEKLEQLMMLGVCGLGFVTGSDRRLVCPPVFTTATSSV